jgi:CDP-2,3-bis-(O-geranylgeranyl)-sn-glycerol synthase
MDLALVGRFLLLLFAANAAPVIAKRAFGEFLAAPIDGGLKLPDGYPLFGRSKTVRGIVVSILCTAALAALIGIGLKTGAFIAAMAMIGDLVSSFIKRRLGLRPGSGAVGLDQIPESLFPALAYQNVFGLRTAEVFLITLSFLTCELAFSSLLQIARLRDPRL